MQPNFINYPLINILAQESEKELEKESEKKPSKTYDWISIIYNTFFSTGHEINKQKET
jgi:hypothetical protein